jgi:hypothetical protein
MDKLRSVKQFLLQRLQTINAILEEETRMSKAIPEDSRALYVPYRTAVLGSAAVDSVGLLEPSLAVGQAVLEPSLAVGQAVGQASVQLNDEGYFDPAKVAISQASNDSLILAENSIKALDNAGLLEPAVGSARLAINLHNVGLLEPALKAASAVSSGGRRRSRRGRKQAIKSRRLRHGRRISRRF